jgi:hypothetical protein
VNFEILTLIFTFNLTPLLNNNLLLMKLNFWFDLPKALTSIAAESLTTEELDYSRVLQKSTEVQ